MQVFGP